MAEQKFGMFNVEFEIEPVDIAAGVAGLGVGACAMFMTETIIDAMLPALTGPADIACKVGKWAVAGVVGDVCGNETASLIKQCNDTADAISESILNAMGITEDKKSDDFDGDIF